MSLGIRGKLFVATVVVILVVEIIVGMYIESQVGPGQVRAVRTGLAVIGLAAVATAAVVLTIVSSQVSRALEPVVSKAAAVAEEEEDPLTSLQSLREMASDLEETMAMLAAERNRFRAVLQTMDQAVLALDPQQRVTTVNRAARSLLSLDDGVEGKRLLEAVRIPGLKQLVEDAEEGRPAAEEFDIPGARRVEARARRQSDGGVVVVVVDVTEIRRLERVRRDFVANVSHELRTPISVIRATAETLLSGGLEDERAGRMFVEAILRHSDRLGRLVADLLDISRIEAGRYPLDLTGSPLAEVVAHVFESVEPDARGKEIELTTKVGPDVRVVADRKALEQVLINLVSNAVKYTQGGGHVQVTVAAPSGGTIRVEVKDDGPGIDPAHRARIFERFYRADPGRSREMGGTGLGLSIVKHLVEAMNGEVGVDARSPHGSVFWFTLADPEASGEAANDPPAADKRSETAVP